MKYKVMIVEDQTMPRELFELRIQTSEHFELALSIDNAALADVYCLRFPVDLILMDVVTRDGESGLDAAERIKHAFPQIKIIIVTSMPECSYLSRAREIGVEVIHLEVIISLDVPMRNADQTMFPKNTLHSKQ